MTHNPYGQPPYAPPAAQPQAAPASPYGQQPYGTPTQYQPQAAPQPYAPPQAPPAAYPPPPPVAGPSMFGGQTRLAGGGGANVLPIGFKGICEVVSTERDPYVQVGGGKTEDTFFIKVRVLQVLSQPQGMTIATGEERNMKFKMAQMGDRNRLVRALTVLNGIDPSSPGAQAWADANAESQGQAATPKGCQLFAGRQLLATISGKDVDLPGQPGKKGTKVVNTCDLPGGIASTPSNGPSYGSR